MWKNTPVSSRLRGQAVPLWPGTTFPVRRLACGGAGAYSCSCESAARTIQKKKLEESAGAMAEAKGGCEAVRSWRARACRRHTEPESGSCRSRAHRSLLASLRAHTRPQVTSNRHLAFASAPSGHVDRRREARRQAQPNLPARGCCETQQAQGLLGRSQQQDL